MDVRLIQIHSTNTNLRTAIVEGICLRLPESGLPFEMYSEPLSGNSDAVRIVTTSRVNEVEIVGESSYEFSTMNSLYRLEIL